MHAIDLLLAASLVLPLLLFGAVAGYDRRQSVAAARQDLLSTSETLRAHAEKLLQFEKLALGAADQWLGTLEPGEIVVERERHHHFLNALRRQAEGVIGITVFGPGGEPLVDSDRPVPLAGINVADREYFAWHVGRPGSVPHLGQPVRSRVDGSPILLFSQRRNAAEGSFLGVIAAGIRQTTLTGFWDRAVPGRDVLVALTRQDGVILVRRPPLPDDAVQFPSASAVVRFLGGLPEGKAVRATSLVDGIERLLVVRQLQGFPAQLVYGVPWEAVLAPWRGRLLIYGGFALAAAAALLALGLLVRRRSRALHELNASLERRVAQRTAALQASEARQRLLAREVDHRCKNALAVVQAALRLTPRHDPAAYAAAVEGRVAALARVQTLLAEDRWRGASLSALLRAELAPFVALDGDAYGPRAELQGPPVLLPPAAAQPLAMAMHELATNALKHGALSQPGGRVLVEWRCTARDGLAGDTLALRWRELGGPRAKGPPQRRGFGSRVLVSVVRGQLGGQLTLSWPASGLVCDLEIPLQAERRPLAADDSRAA
ncbi:HWE histidine kinase domain-containing protein [Pseudoroseomonas cervicalis]|uniref:HWE histidine kinase domain-containing protein n=1 Tax=Teichococcus cervicalis TaxID=204525 RepID=UPI0022F179EB|nr:HWE histidine kinase domain-containing protein [Pseudoroseomonas cervicalis]WBV44889.1 hypothetical protein PFY06_17425 [Pseudoroseomonas cervicalis]